MEGTLEAAGTGAENAQILERKRTHVLVEAAGVEPENSDPGNVVTTHDF